jgi:hypothetical protein
MWIGIEYIAVIFSTNSAGCLKVTPYVWIFISPKLRTNCNISLQFINPAVSISIYYKQIRNENLCTTNEQKLSLDFMEEFEWCAILVWENTDIQGGIHLVSLWPSFFSIVTTSADDC